MSIGDALLTPAMSQHYASSGGGPKPPNVLDNISVPATAAYSTVRKLRAGYSGAAYRMRRTDNVERDIGFVLNDADTADMVSFTGASSAWQKTFYDQGTAARHSTQASGASQPRMVNLGVLETIGAGKPAAFYDGVDDYLQGGDPGFIGDANVTIGVALQWVGVGGFACVFGENAAGRKMGVYRLNNTAPMRIDYDSGGRDFTTIADPTVTASYFVATHTAGGRRYSGTMQQNGVDLAVFGNVGTDGLVNISNFGTGFGSSWGTNRASCKITCCMTFPAVLTGANLSTLATELALHV